MTDRAAARAAKSVLVERLSDDPGVVGVGLARRDDGYVLTVNLTDPAVGTRVPGVVDGVRVVTAVIGAVRPL
jgi:hypothetical protein